MLSVVSGARLPCPAWSSFTFERVLECYDGPRLILQRTEDAEIYLAWWTDADDAKDRWVYIQVTRGHLVDLLSGEPPVRFAFEHPDYGHLLIVDRDAAEEAALPQDTVPLPEACLRVSRTEELLSLLDAIAEAPAAESM